MKRVKGKRRPRRQKDRRNNKIKRPSEEFWLTVRYGRLLFNFFNGFIRVIFTRPVEWAEEML